MGQYFSSNSAKDQLSSIYTGPSNPTTTIEPPKERPFTISEFESPRFDVDDLKFLEYLEEYGYVVIKGVASASDVAAAHDALWEFLQPACGMKKEDPSTWTDFKFHQIGSPDMGILHSNGINHSAYLWKARLLPKVRQAFASIYKDNNLLTSFDGGNIFRPWHNKSIPDAELIRTRSGWFHVDQGSKLRGLQCVQGLVTFTDADAETGGFCVIPGSHKYHDDLVSKYGGGGSNFVRCPMEYPALDDAQILPKLKAGDLLLWDSRTIHCNCPSLLPSNNSNSSSKGSESPLITKSPNELLRMAAYVCMTPAKWATAEVLRTRVKLFERGKGTTHWPHILPFSLDNETEEEERVAREQKRINSIEKVSALQREMICGSATGGWGM